MKKLIAVILAVCLVLPLGLSVFAAKSYSVKVESYAFASVIPEPSYSFSVPEGGDFKFKVSTAAGYSMSSGMVYADGETVFPDANGVYTVLNITGDVTISIKAQKDDKVPVWVFIMSITKMFVDWCHETFSRDRD